MEIVIAAEPLDGTALDDLALSRSLLDRVAAGPAERALRIWRPVPAVAFSKLDLLRPGAAAAAAVAHRAGVEVVQRMSGGHAVVLGGGSLCAGVAEPAVAFEGTQSRYERMSAAIVDALARFGVTAEPGELRGEWCPGAWSIQSGTAKLAGLSQRVVKGAAWTEAVVQLAPADRGLVTDVYAALGLPLEPATLASVAEVRGQAVAFEDMAAALAAGLSG